MPDFDVVTGAFSYSGRAIAAHLVDSGRRVRTVTGHPERRDPASPIEVHPLDFSDPDALAGALAGAETLYNTYWVRFGHGAATHDVAVAHSRTLFAAARRAGVRRIVHISITHPNADSPDPYFRGKALVEAALAGSGVPHTILRPAILFGGRGVLINNIAWLLRHLPVFAVGGTGAYRIRPIHVDDLARLCLESSHHRGTETFDAVGPERPSFLELVTEIRSAVGSRALIVKVPGPVLPVLSRGLGLVLRDVLLTADEYRAMAAGWADTTGPATGTTAISAWLAAQGRDLGEHYLNELRLHYEPAVRSERSSR